MREVPNSKESVDVPHDLSLLVVADTHLGLVERKKRFGLGNEAGSDSVAFSDFLEWIEGLETAPYKLPLGRWGKGRAKLRLPDKLVLLGDFLELWDASDAAIEFASRKVWQTLGEIPSQIVYLIGNHDFAVRELAGATFPVGKKQVEIVEDCHSETVGGIRYIFLHGQQFDTTFRRIRAWTLISYIRDGAEAFRLYSWIIVALTTAWTVGLMLGLSKDWSPIILLLALATLPRVFCTFARPLYNRFLRPRYKSVKALKGFAAWWKDFCKGEQPRVDPLFIVYGHTHLADILTRDDISKSTNKTIQGNVNLINIPAWARDTSEKHRSVLRDAALYIDSKGPKFIGWNWSSKKPFYIPDDIVRLRADGMALDATTIQELRNIDWPDKMLEKWKTPYREGSARIVRPGSSSGR